MGEGGVVIVVGKGLCEHKAPDSLRLSVQLSSTPLDNSIVFRSHLTAAMPQEVLAVS